MYPYQKSSDKHESKKNALMSMIYMPILFQMIAYNYYISLYTYSHLLLGLSHHE